MLEAERAKLPAPAPPRLQTNTAPELRQIEAAVPAAGSASAPGHLATIVFLDVETTGLESYARIVTLGMVWIGLDGNLHKVHLVFDPRKDSHPDAARIHGWDDWTLRYQDLFVDHAQQIHDILGSASLVVAHNAGFDLSFLAREFRKVGLAWPDVEAKCTMEMARQRWPRERVGLDACLARIGIARRGRRHGALEDALLAMQLFCALGGTKPLAVAGSLIPPTNFREVPPRPDGPLPRRTPKKRRMITPTPQS